MDTQILKAMLIATLLAGGNTMALEQPRYEVLFELDGVEFREYAPYMVVETLIETDRYNAAGNEGFRRLFVYISGNNSGQRKIAMTAPVAQAPAGGEKISMTAPVAQTASDGGWTLAFMLPSKYDANTAPAPRDPRVRLREVPARLVAVWRYSGRWTGANYRENAEALRSALVDAEVEIVGPLFAAMYNSPMMPAFLRRNEIHAPVAALPAAAAQGMAASGDVQPMTAQR